MLQSPICRAIAVGVLGILGILGAALSGVNGQPQEQVDPLEQPLKWLYQARTEHGQIRDYTTTFIRQERVQGRLLEQNIIALKVRTVPFSVNMRWLAPAEYAGQKVLYVRGSNRNQMRVKSAKPLQKIAGFVSINLDDPRAMQHSRHTVDELGIGNVIEQTIKIMEQERSVGKTQVRIAEYTYSNQPCHRIEFVRSERHPSVYCYRTVLFLDKQTKLPLRIENYDWPSAAAADGELLEMFSYTSTRFNAGLSDVDFER